AGERLFRSTDCHRYRPAGDCAMSEHVSNGLPTFEVVTISQLPKGDRKWVSRETSLELLCRELRADIPSVLRCRHRKILSVPHRRNGKHAVAKTLDGR